MSSIISFRRGLTALVLLSLCGCAGDVARIADEVRVVARIGVLADVNLRGADDVKMLKRAFAYYRQEGVDAVAIAGVKTPPKTKESPEDVWRSVFAGSQVSLFQETGRHETKGVAFATSVDRPIGPQEVLTFYGKRRLALTDELCVYPRNSRAVCAGSMSGLDLPNGFEDKVLEKKLAKSAEGLLVSVYSDKTVIRRLDFTQKQPEDVAEPWAIGADGTVAEPEKEIAEFWPDTRLQIFPGYDRAERILTVMWPSLLRCHVGARARWYVVEAAFADDMKAVFLSRTVLSGGYHQAEGRDTGAVKTVFKVSDLPPPRGARTQFVFKVTPIGAFGKPGKPLVSSSLPLPK